MRKLNIKNTTPKNVNSKPVKSIAAIVASNTDEAIASSVSPAAKAEKPKAVFAKHELNANYAGPSQPFTSRKSRTPITATFNSYANHPISERDAAFILSLRIAYADKAFPRLNADAGNLRRAIERGYLNYGPEANTFQLTELALTSRLA